MVSNNPTPSESFYLDSTGMPLPGIAPFPTTPSTTAAEGATSAVSLSEDPSKKIRKPYTITKSRESWSEPEHDKFLEALQLFDRDWKKIEAFIGSKTVIQIRSHAQKYFLKVQKSGTGEHLPPPRPKRKASHPYPQKAPKTAPVHSQSAGPFQSSMPFEPGFVLGSDSSPMLMVNPVTSAAASSWTNKVQTVEPSQIPKGPPETTNCSSSTNGTPKTRPARAMSDQRNHVQSLRVLPDFVQVYSFIGSLFDQNVTGHLQTLKQMDPIDVETVLLLMRNLSINLTSPDFEDHRKLLSSYDVDTETANVDSQITA